MRYLTRYSLNANKSSLKSWLNIAGGFLPVELRQRKLCGGVDPLTHGAALPVPIFIGLHLVKAGVLVNGLVHAPFVAGGGAVFQRENFGGRLSGGKGAHSGPRLAEEALN